MTHWRKYNGALIPSIPPHIEVDTRDINQRLIQENAYFARWTSDFDFCMAWHGKNLHLARVESI